MGSPVAPCSLPFSRYCLYSLQFCIGTDQTDLEAAANNGTAVFNSPYANTRSVAELVLGEMIMLARQVMDRSKECHNSFWNKSAAGCVEVRGKASSTLVGDLALSAESMNAVFEMSLTRCAM